MTHFLCMFEAGQHLANKNIPAVVPEEENALTGKTLTPEDLSACKRALSEKYFRIIKRLRTFGILVVNAPKRGLSNYIGPNTLAEIAVAFTARKRIYLLYDFYEAYIDELQAWGAVPLHGSLAQIVQDLREESKALSAQLRLEL